MVLNISPRRWDKTTPNLNLLSSALLSLILSSPPISPSVPPFSPPLPPLFLLARPLPPLVSPPPPSFPLLSPFSPPFFPFFPPFTSPFSLTASVLCWPSLHQMVALAVRLYLCGHSHSRSTCRPCTPRRHHQRPGSKPGHLRDSIILSSGNPRAHKNKIGTPPSQNPKYPPPP